MVEDFHALVARTRLVLRQGSWRAPLACVASIAIAALVAAGVQSVATLIVQPLVDPNAFLWELDVTLLALPFSFASFLGLAVAGPLVALGAERAGFVRLLVRILVLGAKLAAILIALTGATFGIACLDEALRARGVLEIACGVIFAVLAVRLGVLVAGGLGSHGSVLRATREAWTKHRIGLSLPAFGFPLMIAVAAQGGLIQGKLPPAVSDTVALVGDVLAVYFACALAVSAHELATGIPREGGEAAGETPR